MIGQTILHYRIESKLGEGGMGEVYLAHHIESGQPVAIKFLTADRNSDEDDRKRFLHEGKAQSMLDHPNLTKYFDSGEMDGRAFIIMEYVDGVSLKQYVEEAKPRLLDRLELIRQIAEGIAAAHEKGVVHRDIKPENVLVDNQMRVKITDFGLARLRDTSTLTKTGTQMGTPHYMSPEQVDGRRADHRSDIFSLGVLAYELICGRRPFDGDTSAAITYAIAWENHQPMARFAADVPEELEIIVDRCLEKSPNKRYQSAKKLAEDLVGATRQVESGTTAASRGPQARKRRMLRRGTIILALTLVVVASGIGLKYVGVRIESPKEAGAAIPTLAVVMFNNVPDPTDSSRMAQMAASLLTTGLSESKFLHVTSRQRILEILGAIGKDSLPQIDRLTARDLARRANVRWMVTGEVMQTSPRIVISAEVTEVESGTLAASQTVSGAPGEDIFALIDRVGLAVRKNLPLPDSARAEVLPAVADVTTSSPEAYSYYLQGIDFSYEGFHSEAQKSLKRAVELDSTFAMAHYELSRTWNVAGAGELREAIFTALRYSNRASKRERHLIRSRYFRFTLQNDSALFEAQRMVEEFPNDIDGHYIMSIMASTFGHFELALQHGLRIVELDSLDIRGLQIVRSEYDALGDFENALKTINRYIDHSSVEPATLYASRGALFSYYGKSKDAIASLKQALTFRPEFSLARSRLGLVYLLDREYDSATVAFQIVAGDPERETRSYGRLLLALIPFHQGKFLRTLQLIDESIKADELEGYYGMQNRRKRELRVCVLEAQGRYREALAELADVQSIERKSFPPVLGNFRRWQIPLLLAAGNSRLADSIIHGLESDIMSTDTSATTIQELKYAKATIAFANGDFDGAIHQLEHFPLPLLQMDERYLLARALIASGQSGQAVSFLQKLIGRRDDQASYNLGKYVRCSYLLGKAYELAGDVERATTQYREFLETWKDADPDIPEITDARTRVAILEKN